MTILVRGRGRFQLELLVRGVCDPGAARLPAQHFRALTRLICRPRSHEVIENLSKLLLGAKDAFFQADAVLSLASLLNAAAPMAVHCEFSFGRGSSLLLCLKIIAHHGVNICLIFNN